MRILIIGYGLTGRSIKDYFDKYQNNVYIYDEKVVDDQNYYSYEKLLNELPLFDLGIKSPGIKINTKEYLLINSLCREVISEIDYAYLHMEKANIIAITGSNGKTTLATYLYHFLSQKFHVYLSGNVGFPLINYIDEIKKDDIVILELSSYQIRDSKYLSCNELFYTSLSPNHLDVYDSLNHYYADKKRAQLLCKGNIYFLNEINDIKNIQTKQFPIVYDFTKDIQNYLEGYYSILYANVAMNYCLTYSFKKEELLQILKTLKPVEFRLNRVYENKNFLFVNDSKSTTAQSTKYCFESFNQLPRILILGGQHKSSSFDIIKPKVNDLILIYGQDKDKINQQIQGLLFNNLEEIFIFLKNFKGKYVVLFSPGCSSHDQYHSFVERGKHFNELIKKYFGGNNE